MLVFVECWGARARRAMLALWLGVLCPALAAEPPLDLTKDPLGATLAAEYALQAGTLDDAVDWYLAAARAAPDSAELAERAAWIAFLGPDDGKAAEALTLWRARVPRSQAIRTAEIELAIRSGKTRKARAELVALLSDAEPPGWPYALMALSRSGRNPARLGKLIGQLLDADAIPDVLPAWMQLGTLAFGMNQERLAERISAEIVQRFPDEPRVALLRARQLREAGRADDARALLDAADAGTLQAQGLGIALAAEFEALGDFARAEQLLAGEPQPPQIVALRASLLARSDNRAGLAALYDAWRTQASLSDPAQRLLLGQMAEYLEHFDQALDWYEAVPTGEERFRARLRMAVVLHRLERRAEAHALARRLQDDTALEQSMRISAYLLEANLYQQDGDAHGETDVFARGLAAWPDALDLLYARSLMWERRDEVARAEADLRQMLIVEPENTTALNALGYILADRTRRYAEALALIERARLAEPDNPAIIDSYGWVLYRLGRSKDALVHLRRAWTLFKDAEVAAHVGEVLWRMGERDEARWFFEEARKLEPEHRALQRALRETGAWWPVLLLVLLLSGCISRPTPPPATLANEPDRQTWLHNHPDWSFSGRVALRQQGKGGSGRIEWQQQGSHYRIRLSAPVTRQSWQLTGDLTAGHARIEGIEGGPLDSDDGEALLWEATGWDIPVHSLPDWLRGIHPAVGSVDTEGHPQPFQHNGWDVSYPLWHPATDTLPSLPKRIEAVRVDGGADAARIRLLIDRWEFVLD